MSLSSRRPRDPAIHTPASYPVLVDPRTAKVDIAAVRQEIRKRTRAQGVWRWPVSAALADVFGKVRLQRRWALNAIERRKDEAERAAVAEIAFNAAVDAALLKFTSPSVLRFQLTRYQFGALADTADAPHLRRVYRRALDIAIDRAGAGEVLQAAE